MARERRTLALPVRGRKNPFLPGKKEVYKGPFESHAGVRRLLYRHTYCCWSPHPEPRRD